MPKNRKWPVAGMIGMASPVIITKKTQIRFDIKEEELQTMLDDVNMVMEKYGFGIDEISNDYYFRIVEGKANVIDSLKKVLDL